MNASQSQPSGDAGPVARAATVTCDLCGWPMDIPKHCIEQGQILGLLVCTACIEDELSAGLEQQP